MKRLSLTYLAVFALVLSAGAQDFVSFEGGPLHVVHGTTSAETEGVWREADHSGQVLYAMERAVVFASPDSSQPYVEVDPREPVELIRSSTSWAEIRTDGGAIGYVSRGALSDLWIRITKRSKTVWVHRGPDVVRKIPADMAYNFFLDKERRGSNVEPDHWRTPEGLYYVVSKNDQSRFYKALVLSYPSADDAKLGKSAGLISEDEYFAILEADQRRALPPMTTALGGWIEIHGEGSGARTTWTRGCVAITNEAIDDLWASVPVGTPVLIEP